MERGAQQTDVDGSLHADRMRIPKRGGTSYFQGDVGMNPEMMYTTLQIVARHKFSNLPMGRQQRGTVSIEQNKQFGPGG